MYLFTNGFPDRLWSFVVVVFSHYAVLSWSALSSVVILFAVDGIICVLSGGMCVSVGVNVGGGGGGKHAKPQMRD